MFSGLMFYYCVIYWRVLKQAVCDVFESSGLCKSDILQIT
jgi:hypothetical protein